MKVWSYWALLWGVISIFAFSISRSEFSSDHRIPLLFFLILLFVSTALTFLVSIKLNDHINPLSIIFLISLMRIYLPALFIDEYIRNETIKLMVFNYSSVYSSAIIAISSYFFIMFAFLHFNSKRPKYLADEDRISIPVIRASSFIFLISILAIVLFIQINQGFISAIINGSMRNSNVLGGSGYLFYAGLLGISSSAIVSLGLYKKSRSIIKSLTIPFIFVIIFSIMGGRARALIPITIIAYYAWLGKDNKTISLKNSFYLILSVISLAIFFYTVEIFRFRGGYSGIANEELSFDYLIGFATVQMGVIHSIAAALEIPKWYGSATFLADFMWPLNEFFNFGGEGGHAGVMLASYFIGFDGASRQWGVHPTLIGQSIMYGGITGLVLSSLTCGVAIGYGYFSRRIGEMPRLLFSIIFIHIILIYFQSTGVYPQLAVSVFCFYLIRWLGRNFFKRKFEGDA